MLNAIDTLYRYRRILLATTVNDIKARYRGTVLGLTWTFLFPLLFLGLYAAVYLLIFQVRLPNLSSFEYLLLVFSGLIPFLGFSESLGNGVVSVVTNKSLLKNTMFPIELIPVKSVLSSVVTMSVGLMMLMIVLWLRGDWHLTQITVPLLLIVQIMFMIGFIWILSALQVFFQDVGQTVGVLILLLMLISPIAYTEDMIPPKLMPLMYINPLYYMIMLYRAAVVLGRFPVDVFFIFLAIAISTFALGYHIFTRLKPVFSDYV